MMRENSACDADDFGVRFFFFSFLLSFSRGYSITLPKSTSEEWEP